MIGFVYDQTHFIIHGIRSIRLSVINTSDLKKRLSSDSDSSEFAAGMMKNLYCNAIIFPCIPLCLNHDSQDLKITKIELNLGNPLILKIPVLNR